MFTIVWTLVSSFALRHVRLCLEMLGVVLLICAGFYAVHHERDIGRQQVEAAQSMVLAAQEVKNQELESYAKTQVDAALAAYKHTRTAAVPASAPCLRVCGSTAQARRRAVPSRPAAEPHPAAAAGVSAGVPAASPPVAAVTDVAGLTGPDIGPFIYKQLQDADAQIAALQAYIKTCQQMGACQGEVHAVSQQEAAQPDGGDSQGVAPNGNEAPPSGTGG